MREANLILLYKRDEFNILRVVGKKFYNGKNALHLALVICSYNKIVRSVPSTQAQMLIHRLRPSWESQPRLLDWACNTEERRHNGGDRSSIDMAACWKITDKVRKMGSRKRDLIYL